MQEVGSERLGRTSELLGRPVPGKRGSAAAGAAVDQRRTGLSMLSRGSPRLIVTTVTPSAASLSIRTSISESGTVCDE
jgi:hypothetical protein